MNYESIECNLPFERIPTCACDSGNGPPPMKILRNVRSVIKSLLDIGIESRDPVNVDAEHELGELLADIDAALVR